MMEEKPTLTIWETATLIVALFRIFIRTISAILLGPFRGSKGTARFQDHIYLTFARSFTDETSARHLCYLQPNIHEIYTAFAEKEDFEPKWETLPSGNRAYWLGDPEAAKVIVYFHGGGYNLPIGPGHLPFLSHVLSRTPKTSILLLSYDLAWKSKYPTQLRQGVELLTYTLDTLHRSPSSISLGGDSAGANLALGVISHILHPHPELPAVRLQGPMAGAILISPWTFETDRESFHTKAIKDVLSKAVSERYSTIFLGGRKWDGWNEPLCEGLHWWKGSEEVVKEVLITGGADEIFIDNIKMLMERFEKSHPRTTSVIAEGEWHDAMVQPHPKDPKGTSRDAVVAFCNSRL